MSAELDALERAALEEFRRGEAPERRDGDGDGAWIRFGLGCLLAAGRTLRGRRAVPRETRGRSGARARGRLRWPRSPIAG